jgi:hypothetical protein
MSKRTTFDGMIARYRGQLDDRTVLGLPVVELSREDLLALLVWMAYERDPPISLNSVLFARSQDDRGEPPALLSTPRPDSPGRCRFEGPEFHPSGRPRCR